MNTDIMDLITLILREPKLDIPSPGDAFGSTSMTLPLPRAKGLVAMQTLKVTTETTRRLETPQQPCLAEEESNVNLLDCVDNVFEAKEGCSLSWRVVKEIGRSAKLCNKTELENYGRFMREVMDMATIEKMHEEIGCSFYCNRTVSNF